MGLGFGALGLDGFQVRGEVWGGFRFSELSSFRRVEASGSWLERFRVEGLGFRV